MAVGLFAGRGDTILAMGLALLVGFWVGYKVHSLLTRLRNRKAKVVN